MFFSSIKLYQYVLTLNGFFVTIVQCKLLVASVTLPARSENPYCTELSLDDFLPSQSVFFLLGKNPQKWLFCRFFSSPFC